MLGHANAWLFIFKNFKVFSRNSFLDVSWILSRSIINSILNNFNDEFSANIIKTEAASLQFNILIHVTLVK